MTYRRTYGSQTYRSQTYGSQKFTVFLIALHVLSITICFGEDVRSSNKTTEGRPLATTNQQRSTAKLKHYGTTVPLLLVGEEWRPVSLLQSQGHPASLKVLIETEEEQLLLILEKNHGLFASHYTETHYLEDGSAVTGSHNLTMNCYYHGKVQGHIYSDVSLSTCSGLSGFISLENRSYVLEPSTDPSGRSCGIHWRDPLTAP
ncbi:disintegrin and metalloproteinase domain-containing protein 12, partial [Oncorhynchus kisutch]|uniref:disintegrin and metalloproteinase domain-containing protein 12 n=1 Tax=Oncorhynchus kisutch TaxID=8019 RepID=UPI0012DC6FD8